MAERKGGGDDGVYRPPGVPAGKLTPRSVKVWAAMCLGQRGVIFPGSRYQSKPESRVEVPDGAELVSLNVAADRAMRDGCRPRPRVRRSSFTSTVTAASWPAAARSSTAGGPWASAC